MIIISFLNSTFSPKLDLNFSESTHRVFTQIKLLTINGSS
ncbi:hypothetical protein KSS87_006516 [Heliosperma pusillum]|nr:hypothetical protein KSS87_006516 [Heliosperma pusillum]